MEEGTLCYRRALLLCCLNPGNFTVLLKRTTCIGTIRAESWRRISQRGRHGRRSTWLEHQTAEMNMLQYQGKVPG